AKLDAPAYQKIPLASLPDAEIGELQKSLVIDLRASAAYREKHVKGALWGIRPRLERLSTKMKGRPVVLVADEPVIARAAAFDLADLGVKEVSFLAKEKTLRMELESSPGIPADAERIDFLFFTARRHEGDRAEAEKYLSWEIALVGQLDAQERATFRI